jgi:hypothetical protein
MSFNILRAKLDKGEPVWFGKEKPEKKKVPSWRFSPPDGAVVIHGKRLTLTCFTGYSEKEEGVFEIE